MITLRNALCVTQAVVIDAVSIFLDIITMAVFWGKSPFNIIVAFLKTLYFVNEQIIYKNVYVILDVTTFKCSL